MQLVDGQAPVSHPHHPCLSQEQVLRLDVSVYHPSLMHHLKRLQQRSYHLLHKEEVAIQVKEVVSQVKEVVLQVKEAVSQVQEALFTRREVG